MIIPSHAEVASRLSPEVDAQGKATGWLLGNARAISDAYDLLPRHPPDTRLEGTRQWIRRLNSFGVTGVLDPGGYNLPLSAYSSVQRLWQSHELRLRVVFNVSAPHQDTELKDFQQLTALIPMGWGDATLRFNGIGENVSWGMYNNPRPAASDQEHLLAILMWAAQQKLGVTFHWNQDETVNDLLDVIARVQSLHDVAPLRWSIAHLNNASESTLRRMKSLGLGWLVQDALYFQRDRYVQAYGEPALEQTPRITTALRLGLHVGMGTDAHRVMDPNPFICLQWLVDGRDVAGRPTRGSDRLLTRQQALDLYTSGSAWFAHDETTRGRIAVGMLADVVVLNDNYLKIPVSQIHSLHSVLTLLGGDVVFAAEDFTSLMPG